MNAFRKQVLLFLVIILCSAVVSAQYILNGSATRNSCNCYTLTPATATQSGSVWNGSKINLTSSFDFWFNVNLGCSDAGADGIVFMLQPISTSVGSTGEGMGFAGVSPSIGIALDTYQNTNLADPSSDHISIQANGVVNHSSDLAGPVAISSTSDNIEDCNWHKLRITWDAGTKWLRTYFNGVLRVEKQIDLVTTIFNNDPNVYWGFTGATGGAVNLQQFCTALNPVFTSNFNNNIACEGNAVQFTNASESFAPIVGYNWDFGDGSFSTAANPPPHTYALPGSYVVRLKITGLDGCETDSSKTITVAANATAALQVFDTCAGKSPRLLFTNNATGLTYQWRVDGVLQPGPQPPVLDALAAGNHQLQLIATSVYNCGQPATATADFIIKPAPQLAAAFDNACINESVNFFGSQTDNSTTITSWSWHFGDNISASGQNVQHSYPTAGTYTVGPSATASNGCAAAVINQPILINKAVAFAGRDTAIIKNYPAQLSVQGNGSFLWSPATGLSSTTIANPLVTLANDQAYTLTVTTPEGCTAADTLLVKVFNGPAIYVPSAFTPNSDGKNEILLPVYAGIKELKLFAVFNRWGQRVFQTNSMLKGWEGRGATGTYVWVIEAQTTTGQRLILKGTVTLIR